MWTFADNEKAIDTERWLMSSGGIWPLGNNVHSSREEIQNFVRQRAEKGSELHIKAIQHLALCKLLNISAFPTV